MNQSIKMNKTALLTLSAVLFFAFSIVSSASADFWAVNEDTGFNSYNKVSASGMNVFVHINTNSEGALNWQGVATDTGNNSSDNNTGSGMTNSGLISVLGGVSNELNLNVLEQSNNWWGQSVGAKNDTTGAESTNKAKSEFDSSLTVVNDNGAEVYNNIGVDANTGSNTADNNTGDGDVKSGKALSDTSEINAANVNSFESSGDLTNMFFDVFAGNMTTGYNSHNKAKTDIDNSITSVNSNNASFYNGSTTTLNTGDNSSDNNTGNGGVKSGKAEGEIEIVNDANTNLVEVEVSGSEDSSLTAVNDTTGAESTNKAKAELDNTVDLISSNDASFSSSADITSTTGSNTANNNTGNGSTETGDASGKIFIDNGSWFNSNDTSLSFENGMFDVSASNNTTGFNSDNKATADLDNSATVVNDNGAEVYNSGAMTLNSGDNESNDNTGNGTVDSGNVNGGIVVVNDLNANNTEVSWLAMGDVTANNDTTGADSANEAKAEVDNDLTVVNTNDSSLSNESTIDANTGGNTSSNNTGSGSSQTGSSTVIFGLINQGNSNSTLINQ